MSRMIVLACLMSCVLTCEKSGDVSDRDRGANDFVLATEQVVRGTLELAELLQRPSRADLGAEAGFVISRTVFLGDALKNQKRLPENPTLENCPHDWYAASAALATALGPVLELTRAATARYEKGSGGDLWDVMQISGRWDNHKAEIKAEVCALVAAARTCGRTLSALNVEARAHDVLGRTSCH